MCTCTMYVYNINGYLFFNISKNPFNLIDLKIINRNQAFEFIFILLQLSTMKEVKNCDFGVNKNNNLTWTKHTQFIVESWPEQARSPENKYNCFGLKKKRKCYRCGSFLTTSYLFVLGLLKWITLNKSPNFFFFFLLLPLCC